MEQLILTSPAFANGGFIPKKHTARGEDLSSALNLFGLASGAVSLAVTIDDASHPLFLNFNHWVIWNLPVVEMVPEGISHGKVVNGLGNAMQGHAYGKNRYKGPKPPLRTVHSYVFTAYVLDCALELSPRCRKKDFLIAAQGHILQMASISGRFQSRQR